VDSKKTSNLKSSISRLGFSSIGSNERIHKLELVNALSSFGCYNYVQDQWTSTRQVEMEQKSLFATKNGYLCLAHSSVDSIAVLLGAYISCVIRKQDTTYHFITVYKIYSLDTVRVLETTSCSKEAQESENTEERAEPQCSTYADGVSSPVKTTRTTRRMQLLYATLTQGYGWPQMMAQATTPAAAIIAS
jgi:hypothetical protein